MQVPILTKRATARRKQIESATMAKTLAAVEKSLIETGDLQKGFLSGNAATMMSSKGAVGSPNRQPGTSWSSQTSLSNKLIARVQQNLASEFGQAPEQLELSLAEQGLSWGPPFPPGRPLDPFYGYRRPARTWDYPVGSNVQLTPRWNRVSFPTIKSIYEAYDVAQICVRHLINDVRSLDYNWEPIPGIKADVSDDIEAAIEFFDSPDKRQPFRAWLAEYLQDVLRYDAGALYCRRNGAGDPIAWEVIDGTTLIPLVDFYGRRPEDENDETADPEGLFGGEIVPAYVQIIEGLPWDWLAADDITYQPWNPLPDSQYGLAPLEAVLLSANTDIRFQWHFLQFFTEGTMPAGFMEAPPDMSDPAQIQDWQEAWDAIMLGDQTKTRQIRWVPNGAKFQSSKPDADKFSPEFVLYLARRTMAAFGVTPNDLGFTESVNRATGDTQIDVQFRVGTSPLLRHCEDVINLFTKQTLKLRCRIHFDDGKETEDRVAVAQADSIYLDHGVKDIDEVRQALGLPVDKSKPAPRYINNSRSGPIPLIALESMAGEIDPETYGRADSQELVSTPYASPPGVIPPAGSPELKASVEQTGQAARDLRVATTGEPPPTAEEVPAGAEEEEAEPPAGDALKEAYWWIDRLLNKVDRMEKGIDNTTETARSTDGVTVSTGIQGSDLDDEDEDEDIVKAQQVALSLRRWRENSRNRLKKGQAPKEFVDPTLPANIFNEVWTKLSKAKTRNEVDAAFAGLGKAEPAKRAAFHSQADAIVGHYTPLVANALETAFSAAAIEAAVKAADAARSASASKAAADSDPVAQAAREALSAKSTAELDKVLTELYGDSFLQGAHDAAHAAGADIVASLRDVTAAPSAQYWNNWKPGYGAAAAKAADGGMREMLDRADVTIRGLTDTSIDRLGNTISDGLAKGDSYEAVAKLAREALGSPARAEMVVNTEYNRAMTEASVETYKAADVEQVEWLAESDACEECEAEAALGAHDLDGAEQPPMHPRCRCALIPIVDLNGASDQ